ncbi:apolipoprotein M isoform X1 [Neoarius graeffei]|uniref:apolipoprotein M isoform X1 n=1 Tax=Neoarius graeffei TaxID=443677 RepID=UPI00298C847A|nr:apolipoprotein M isoform X1 [Neoarius graeffei]
MLMGFIFFPIQYLGKWYYVGVASWDDEDIESYKSVDNSVVELKKSGNNTLIMAAALHQEDKCLNTAWTYNIDPDIDPFLTEGPAENLGVFLDGDWIQCPSCLIVAKFHTESNFFRVMLFARSENLSDSLVKNFQSKLGCFYVIDKFIISPRTKEFCKLEGTA